MYDSQHLRLTFGGKLFASESWSCGLRVCGEPQSTGEIVFTPAAPVPGLATLHTFALANLENVAADVVAYWNSIRTFMNQAASLDWVKFNAVGTDGKQDESVNTVATNFTPIPGTSTGQQFPQIALAISLMTGLARGFAHTGRFYLPLGGSSALDGQGHIGATQCEAFADATTGFINAVNDWEGVDPLWRPVVCIMSAVGTGTRHKVRSVRVGRAVDTQRRRRAQITELYSTSSLTVD